MLKDQIIETFNYVIDALKSNPVTYLNAAAITVSMSNFELGLKILLYLVSISASVLVSFKYLLEIKKLDKDNKAQKNEEV